MSDSLSGKTRKMVPSAMPAASAIWRVVSLAPCSISSGMVADDDGGPTLAWAAGSGAVAGLGVELVGRGDDVVVGDRGWSVKEAPDHPI